MFRSRRKWTAIFIRGSAVGGKKALQWVSREIFTGKYRLRLKRVAIRWYLSDVLFPLIKIYATVLFRTLRPDKIKRTAGFFFHFSKMRSCALMPRRFRHFVLLIRFTIYYYFIIRPLFFLLVDALSFSVWIWGWWFNKERLSAL